MELELKIDEKLVYSCLVYEGDTPQALANKIAKKYKLIEEEKKLVIDQLNQHF